MSSMIQCDSCKKVMYADSRSENGDYYEVCIDREYIYHLCRSCYAKLMITFLRKKWNKEDGCWEDAD